MLFFSPEEKELLDNLCKTLNAEYFFRLSNDTRKCISSISAAVLNSPYFNPSLEWRDDVPLENRVRNPRANLALAWIIWRSENPAVVKQIKGVYPSSVIKVLKSSKYNMRVMLINDPHENHPEPVPIGYMLIDNYISREILASNELIDLYLERYYNTVPYPSYENRFINSLEGIGHIFKDCLIKDKDKCKYFNLRSHLVDTRTENFDPSMGLLSNLSKLFVSAQERESALNKLLSPEVKEWTESPDTIRDHIWKIINSGRIKKNLDAIEEPEIREGILKTIRYLLNVQDPNIPIENMIYSKIEESIRNLDSKNSGHMFKPIFLTVARVTGLVMDTYTLSRLFRSYNVNSINKYYFSGRARNAIIYTGGAHLKNYNTVLSLLGFVPEYSTHSTSYQPKYRSNYSNSPIDFSTPIGNIPQPFFVTKSMTK